MWSWSGVYCWPWGRSTQHAAQAKIWKRSEGWESKFYECKCLSFSEFQYGPSSHLLILKSLVRRYLHSQGYISSVPRFNATSPSLSPIIQRTLPAGVDSHAVDAFLYRQGPGPTSENIQFFWNATMKHSWNKAAIHLMERQFLLYAKKNHLSEIVAVFGEICLSPTNDFDEMLRKAIDIKHCISTKLDTQRSTIQTASRELTLAKHQSPHNFSAMLTQKRVSIAIRNRRYERRVGVCISRISYIPLQPC